MMTTRARLQRWASGLDTRKIARSRARPATRLSSDPQNGYITSSQNNAGAVTLNSNRGLCMANDVAKADDGRPAPADRMDLGQLDRLIRGGSPQRGKAIFELADRAARDDEAASLLGELIRLPQATASSTGSRWPGVRLSGSWLPRRRTHGRLPMGPMQTWTLRTSMIFFCTFAVIASKMPTRRYRTLGEASVPKRREVPRSRYRR